MGSGHKQCTLRTLHNVIAETKPKINAWSRMKNKADPLDVGIDCHEVYPNIFVGDAGCARNKSNLKMIGITHVLNTAEGHQLGQVNTSEGFYSPVGIKYKGMKLTDMPQTRIYDYFYDGAEFISTAINQERGKILVHCMMGLSRSATMAIAYLMIKERINVAEALKTVRSNRYIRPNDGFLRQLIELDLALFNK